MQDKGNRFWDPFWVVAPLIMGLLIGVYFAGQFPSSTSDCNSFRRILDVREYALAIVLVVLLVARVVAPR